MRRRPSNSLAGKNDDIMLILNSLSNTVFFEIISLSFFLYKDKSQNDFGNAVAAALKLKTSDKKQRTIDV